MTDPQTIIDLAQQLKMTDADMVDLLKEKTKWEDKFRQLMLLGKQLPSLPDELQQDEYLVSGCESKVWLIHHWHDNQLFLAASSDAKIVKGLVSVVVAAFNQKSKQQIRDFDLSAYFAQLNLLNQLSVSRANGLRAIVDKINDFCH